MFKMTVSQISSKVNGKSLDGIPAEVLEAARIRGYLIHEDVEKNTYQTDEGAWIKNQLGSNKIITEQSCIWQQGERTIRGRYDIKLVENSDIIDIKTEATPDLRYWATQLNLYKFIDKAEGRLFVYHVPKSGNYKVYEIPLMPDEKIAELIDAAFNDEILSDEWWSFMEGTAAEELTLDLIVSCHDVGFLETNIDSILQTVTQRIASYSPENYSTDNIDVAKKDKAGLNKAAKFLNEKRIEIEKAHMQAIAPSIEKLKKAKQLVETASGKIDEIVKSVEEKEKEEIRKDLQDHFKSLDFSLVSFDRIFEKSWLNKTAKRKESKKAIEEKIQKVKDDLEVLREINCEDARVFYLRTLNLNDAIAEYKRIAETKARIEQESKKEAEQVQSAINEPLQYSEEVKESIPEDKPEEIKQPIENIYTRRFIVTGTKDQLNGISEYMNTHGIEWEILKED